MFLLSYSICFFCFHNCCLIGLNHSFKDYQEATRGYRIKKIEMSKIELFKSFKVSSLYLILENSNTKNNMHFFAYPLGIIHQINADYGK